MRAHLPALVAFVAALPAQEPSAAKQESPEEVALRLGDPDSSVRRAAVEKLLDLRPDLRELRDRLVSITGEPVEDRSSVAFLEFEPAAPADLESVAAGLEDEDPDVRRRAVQRLCNLREEARAYQEDVLELLGDADADVRAAVAKHVARLGWNEEVRAAVLQALKDASPVVRKAAAEALGEDRNDAGIVAVLRGAIQDPDLDVRTMVVRSLGKCGSAGRAAAADIVAMLRDREEKVRVAALEAVRSLELHDARAVEGVVRCLDDTDRKVLEAALRAAMTMGEAAAASTGRALELTQHERDEVRAQALSAAWGVAPENRRGAVILRTVELLGDAHKRVAGRAEAHLLKLVRESRR